MKKISLSIATLLALGSISLLGGTSKSEDWKAFFREHGKGVRLISSDISESFRTRHKKQGKVEIVNVKGMPFKKAIRFTVKKQLKRPYMLQTVAPVLRPITNGSVVVASFYARTISTHDESGYGTLAYSIGITYKPWSCWNKWQDSIDTKWKKYYLPAYVFSKKGSESYQAGEIRLCFNAGFSPQVVEIGGVEFMDYGRSLSEKDLPELEITYEGRSLDASWRKAAEKRIEKYRKGDLVIKVQDKDGKVVQNINIKLEMTKHAFAFGAAFNASWYFATKDRENAKRYLKTYKNNFNRVSHIGLLKWPHWKRNRELAINSVKFLKAQGFEVRGHCVIWPRWDRTPWDEDLKFQKKMESDKKAFKKLLNDHIKDEMGALKGMCVEWDVYNEPYSHYHFPEILGDKVMVDWFRVAKETDPGAKMFINEGGHLSKSNVNSKFSQNYIKLIKYLQANNAPLEGIGFESHFGWRLPHPQKVYDTINYFYKNFKLPIGITEFDQVVKDEKLQADWERDFLTITFSHPAVNEFIRWGVWNGISKRGFINTDWTLKPNGKVWRDLVFNKWWTKENGKTNDEGVYKTRAFLGEYKITVSDAKKTKVIETSVVSAGKLIVVRF